MKFINLHQMKPKSIITNYTIDPKQNMPDTQMFTYSELAFSPIRTLNCITENITPLPFWSKVECLSLCCHLLVFDNSSGRLKTKNIF